jgi:hypothetical protein
MHALSELLLRDTARISTQHHIKEVNEAAGDNNVELILSRHQQA